MLDINIGGLIIASLICYLIFVSNSSKEVYMRMFILCVIVELMVERGFVIKIGEREVAYRTICEILLVIISLIMIIKNKKTSIKIFKNYALLIASLLIGWFMLVLIPTDAKGITMDISWERVLVNHLGLRTIEFSSGMIIEIIQVCMYIIIGLVVHTVFDRKDWKRILHKIVKYTRWILYFNSIEILTKYIFKTNLFLDIIDSILGDSIATLDVLNSRGNGYALCGLTKEPSHYSFVLTVLLIVYLICFNLHRESNNVNKIKKDICGIVVAAISISLSMSFSTLFYLACMVLFVLCIVFERKGHSVIKMWGIVATFAIAVIVIIKLLPSIAENMSYSSFWGRRLLSVVEELKVISSGKWLYAKSALEWSNRVRLGSTYETFKLITYRPLFGFGFGSVAAHSSLAMLFSGCGLIGTFCYIKCIFFTGSFTISNKYKGLYLSLIIVFLLITLFASLSLRPFYEIWNLVIAQVMKEWIYVRQTVKNNKYGEEGK